MKPLLHSAILLKANTLFKITLSVICIFICTSSGAQTNQWTWVSGDNTTNNAGIYGTKGTAAAANKPGERNSQNSFIDASGNFWIFGGLDHNGNYYNDLWKYTPGTGLWTWMSGDNTTGNSGVYGTKGTAAGTNKPGARYGQASWIDGSGNFWIFGGRGYDAIGNKGYLNDLWKYNPSTGQWTWISGDNTRNNLGIYGTKGTAAAANKAGGRRYSSGWIDGSGNFWIFGGYGYDGSSATVGNLNDLWKYNPSTAQWTWISGDNIKNVAGVYGTKGTAAATNKPGNRDSQSGWIDGSGNFWIFGGWDISSNLYNDLWMYKPSTGLWTWMSGDNTTNNGGIYGTKGTAAATNKPGSRIGQSAFMDAGGNFYIFGGAGYDNAGTLGGLNDFWRYTTSTGLWTWVNGDNTANSAGVYGTKGTAAATNKPGGRYYQSGWSDAAFNVWIFGGLDISGNNFNDLWKFTSLVTLPIRQVSFEGLNKSDKNFLSWQTIDEINTLSFDIERSENGTDFSVIGSVSAVGKGNNNYSFTDDQLLNGNLYYQLRMQDNDGVFTYSKIIMLSAKQSFKFNVYPNPAKNNITLQIFDNSLLNTYVSLFDPSGRLVNTFRITSWQQNIDLSRVQSGICFLQLSNGKTVKILKE